MKIHPWEKEYIQKKLVTLSTIPQQDTKDFLKWLRKDQEVTLEDKKVLDCGCGNGRNSFLFIENGATAVGYDVSKTVIQIANNLKREKGYTDEATFFIHHMQDKLSYEDNYFDFCIDSLASNALCDTERELYMSELVRVLKPGSYLYVKTLCKDGDDNAKYLLRHHPAEGTDRYHLVGSDITERVFTKKDIVNLYEKDFTVHHLERKFNYPTFDGKVYKRAYWLLYLQKK